MEEGQWKAQYILEEKTSSENEDIVIEVRIKTIEEANDDSNTDDCIVDKLTGNTDGSEYVTC